MSRRTYFTDKEGTHHPSAIGHVPDNAWRALSNLIEKRIEDGSFGLEFPLECSDFARGTIGTDRHAFMTLLLGEVPNAEECLVETSNGVSYFDRTMGAPETGLVADILQYCFWYIAAPSEEDFHQFFGHYHLSFNQASGRATFRDRINMLFQRNGVMLRMHKDGKITRTFPDEIRELLQHRYSSTDPELNKLVTEAILGIGSAHAKDHVSALERLWSAWERLKSLAHADKKTSADILLDRAAKGNGAFLVELENEARALTKIGNEFRIRHHEKGKVSLEEQSHHDYLFFRLMSMLRLLEGLEEE